MNNASRVHNSKRNLVHGLVSQVITLILNFIVRTFFVKYLSVVYLGVNGLFANILTVLSLAELGFGTAMVYSMYKPLANNDNKKIQALINLYAKVYAIIGIIVAIMGFSLIPFMDYIILDQPNISNLTLIYLLYLINSVSSYFFAYKKSVLIADQKAYINSQYRYIFSIIRALLQIGILIIYKSFIIYLVIQVLATIAENIFVSHKVNRMYPFLKGKNSEKLSDGELKRIKEDVKALILSNIGRVALDGTDNIIISAKVGVQWVGLLSNYTLVTGSLIMIISQVTAAITGSLGNFIAKEKTERSYELFKKIDFMNYWLYGFSTVCFVILINPFITLWLGDNFTLSWITIIVIGSNFLIDGLLNSLWTFRTTMGLFIQGKYRPIIAALINIIFSLILSQYLGLIGVLLGTTVSKVLVNAWFDPYIIFKHGFKESPKKYYIRYLTRVLLLVIITTIIYIISSFLMSNGITISEFILMAIICGFVSNLTFVLLYYKTPEFKYLLSILRGINIDPRKVGLTHGEIKP